MSVSDQIIGAESGGDATATNPNSSAAGAGQFIDSTWLSTLKAHRPDLTQGKSDDEILAMRSDPDLSKQMVDAYASDNSAILAKNGLPVTPGSTYLAHFAGPQGAISVLKADPNAPISGVLGASVVKANPFLTNMSAGDLIAWANRKMGTNSAQPVIRPDQGQPPASPQIAPRGVLNAAGAVPASPGILAAPDDDTMDTFRNTLAQLAAQRDAQQAPMGSQLAPINFAMPKALRQRYLAALSSSSVGGS